MIFLNSDLVIPLPLLHVLLQALLKHTILKHDGECREGLEILALLAIFTEKRLSHINFNSTLAGHFREKESWLVGQKRRMVLEVKGGENRKSFSLTINNNLDLLEEGNPS